MKVTPVDHVHARQGSGPKLPAKPRHVKERVLDKARNLLGDLPKKSPQAAKRLKRDGDASRLLSPEEQAVGPTIWMDTVDQKYVLLRFLRRSAFFLPTLFFLRL